MRAVTLLYHDIVHNSDWDSSGFSCKAEARYKMNIDIFRDHLLLIKNKLNSEIITYFQLEELKTNQKILTFDDGGISFLKIADLIEKITGKVIFL